MFGLWRPEHREAIQNSGYVAAYAVGGENVMDQDNPFQHEALHALFIAITMWPEHVFESAFVDEDDDLKKLAEAAGDFNTFITGGYYTLSGAYTNSPLGGSGVS